MAIDPVCGMEVDEKTAPAKCEYKGKTYYFCHHCQKTFEKNPERYTVERRVKGGNAVG